MGNLRMRILRAVAGRLSDGELWEALGLLAPRCGVSAVSVTGEYGTIRSSPADREILPRYAKDGVWARRTNDLLRDFFRPAGGRYIDVGANIGLTTIPVAQDARVRCLAIEPEPLNYANLRANVAVNCPAGNVETVQAAAYSERTILELEIAAGNLGDHRIRLENRAGRMGEERWPTIRVEARPLDELNSDLRGPLAVKIDTQGAEPFVFAGGARTLSAADLIVAEWAPYWLARLGGDPAAVVGLFTKNFDRISIADGEEGAVPAPEPAAVAAERLLRLASEHRDDPSRYFDVVARR